MELLTFKHLETVLKQYGKSIETTYKSNLRSDDKLASGELINSVKFIYSHKSNKWEINLKMKDYWKWVEYDTRPHFPPPSAILKWIEIKPVLPYPDKNGKLPTEKQLAYLIGRKISQVGTKGTHDLNKTVMSSKKIWEIKIINALTLDLDESVGLMITQTFE